MAEKNIYDDSNTTLIKLGMFAEYIVEFMFAYDNLEKPEDTSQSNRIRILKRNDLLPYEIDNILYTIRINRNKAAHEGYKSFNDAKICLTMAHKLGVWFMQTYGDWSFEPEVFIMPNENKNTLELEQLKIENEKLVEEYELETKKLKSELEKLRISHTDGIKQDRQKQSIRSASKINLDEAETRKIIDDKLRNSGWEIDTEKLRYSNATRPQKNKNLAIQNGQLKMVEDIVNN